MDIWDILGLVVNRIVDVVDVVDIFGSIYLILFNILSLCNLWTYGV